MPRWTADLTCSPNHPSTAPPEISRPSIPPAAAHGLRVSSDLPSARRLGMGACIGLALPLLGALVLTVPGILRQDSTLALPLSVISFAVGAALVIHRQLSRSRG